MGGGPAIEDGGQIALAGTATLGLLTDQAWLDYRKALQAALTQVKKLSPKLGKEGSSRGLGLQTRRCRCEGGL
jgi:hypothetical protein